MNKTLRITLAVLLCVAVLLAAVLILFRFVRNLDGLNGVESPRETPDSQGNPLSEPGIPQELPEKKDSGIYVLLERNDVYSIRWYFENKSGGMSNADSTALPSGEYIYLDNDIEWAAANLERPVSFMLTVAGSDGGAILQTNLLFDPDEPVMLVTIGSGGEILVNGEAAAQEEIPEAYKALLNRYRVALAEGWNGQQLVDAGLNFVIRDMAPEAVGYSVEDLDGDGVPELSIGSLSEDEFYGKMIFELYTLDDNGEALQIFSGMERNRYYYAGGNRFANLSSSAFDDSFETTLKLEGGETVDMCFSTESADYVQMELTPIL